MFKLSIFNMPLYLLYFERNINLVGYNEGIIFEDRTFATEEWYFKYKQNLASFIFDACIRKFSNE